MRIFLTIIAIAISISTVVSEAQNDRIKYYLQLAAQGRIDEVKRDLPDLLVDYPDEPGVQLLHAVILDDVFKSVKLFEKIFEKYPTSEFADEAYWRTIQFYAIKGDTSEAGRLLEKYRKAFPSSQYLIIAAEALRSASGITRTSGRTTVLKINKTQPETPKKTEPQPEIIKAEPVKKSMPEPESPKKNLKKKGSYGLQVGIYSTLEAAEQEVERFKDVRLKAEILTKSINGEKKFAVVIGDYSTKESAEAAKNIVQQQCNCSPLIFEK
jgi:hypothetical protein